MIEEPLLFDIFLAFAAILCAAVILGSAAGAVAGTRTEKDRKELREAMEDFCATINGTWKQDVEFVVSLWRRLISKIRKGKPCKS